MKYLMLIFCICSLTLNAQITLKFNKRFVECEDKWVAFQMGKDSAYSFGFIYIDSQAGLTLNYEGEFKITTDNIFIPSRMDSINVKYRLEPNQVKVAIIPAEKFNELQITEIPDWLKYYKTDTLSIERLYRWGFLYNSWNECEKALTFLEKGYKMEPKYTGLEFELGFAYNALEQYEKAITVLDDAIKTSPDECYLYKELVFAQVHSDNLTKGSETAKRGLKVCKENVIKAEIAFNMAYQYFLIKDKENFKYWVKIAKKESKKNNQMLSYIKQMEIELK